MQKSKDTYVVTGAAGFIGSHLCRAILTQYPGSTVVGIDNINAYYDPKIKLRRIRELSKNKGFIFYKTSILEWDIIRDIASRHKPAILIHTAAEVGVRNGEAHPLEYFSTNVMGTLNVLEATAPFIQHAIVFSSSSVYGSTRRLPFQESEPLLPSTPLSTYGASKLTMEIATQSFFKRTGVPITIVRPFSIYGPDGRPDMLPMKLLMSAYKNSGISLYAPDKTWRDWTYIDDCVEDILALLKIPRGMRIINIGSGKPIRLDRTIKTAQSIIQKYGYSFRYVIKPSNPTEIAKTWADTAALHIVRKKRTITRFESGYQKTADYFFSHKDFFV